MATYHQSTTVAPPDAAPVPRAGWRTVRLLLPYLWDFKGRVAVALVFLVGFAAFVWGPGRSSGGTVPDDETGRDMGGVGNAQNERARLSPPD